MGQNSSNWYKQMLNQLYEIPDEEQPIYNAPIINSSKFYEDTRSQCGGNEDIIEKYIYDTGKNGASLKDMAIFFNVTQAYVQEVINNINNSTCGNASILLKSINQRNGIPTYWHAIPAGCEFRYRGAWSCGGVQVKKKNIV